MKKTRYKYDVIVDGRQQSWTGVFETKELSDKWYNRYGIWWESRGYILKEVVTNGEKDN